MAEQKWHFRFRFPWTPSTPGKDPAARSQPPDRATSGTSDQKPVSRSRASASSQSAPPRTRARSRTESQPPSQLSSTTRSGAALPRASASRAAARPRVASQPPISPRAATRPRAASQPPITHRAATRPKATTSQPPMPTREATAPMPPSPPHGLPQAGGWVTAPQSPTSPVTESEAASSQPPTPTRVEKGARAVDKSPSPPRVSAPQPQVSPSLSLPISESQPALQAAAQSQSPPKLASHLTEQTSSPQSPVASQPPVSAAKEPQFTTRPPSPPPVSPEPQVPPSPSLTIYGSQPALQDAAQSQSTSKLTSQPTHQTAPQSPVVSQPPTSAAKEPQATTRSPSPPPVSPKPGVTPTPSLTISETQPILQETAQSQSLPKLAPHPAAETSLQPSSLSFMSVQTKPEEEPKRPPPSVSNEKEQRPSRSQPEPQDSWPEEERTTSPTEQRTFQDSATPTRPSETPLPAAVGAPEPDVRSEKFIPGKELNASIITEEPRPRIITEFHDGRMHPSVPLDLKLNQMEKEAILNGLGGLDTSSSNIERIKGMMDDISTFVNKVAAQQQKLTVNEKAIGLITIAGENRGASMQLDCYEARKGVPVPIKRRYKNDLDEVPEATSDEEERPEYLENGDQPGRAFNYINSNAQAVNSSILLDRSIVEAKPCVPS